MMRTRYTLAKALPATLFLAVLCMLAATFAVDLQLHRADALERLRAQALMTAEHIARGAERNLKADPSAVAADVSAAFKRVDLVSIVVVDTAATVQQAHRFAWRGQPAAQLLPSFNLQRFERVVQGGLADLEVSDDLAHLTVMTPFVLPGSTADLRSQERGAVFVHYDLGHEYAMAAWSAGQRLLTNMALATVFLGVLVWFLYRRVIHPLRQLELAVQRYARDGGQIAALEAGPQEVVHLSQSFHALATNVGKAQHLASLSQARMEGIVEAAMDAIITVDQAHRMVVVNQAALELFQYPLDALIGQSVNMLLPHKMRAAHDAQMEGFAKKGISRRMTRRHAVVDGQKSDGSTFPAEASISQLNLGGVTYLTVIMRDVTQRLRAEQEILALNANLEQQVVDRTASLQSTLQALSAEQGKLQQAHAQQSAIFDMATVGIVLIADGIIVRGNPKLEEIFGYAPDEMMGQNTRIWFSGDAGYQQARTVLQSFDNADNPVRQEMEMQRKDGSRFWAAISARSFADSEHPNAVLAVLEDMTLAHETTAAIELARLQAEQASLAKSSFLANMSHEIRTPMNAIMGMSYLVLKTELSERQRGYLTKIQASSQHLLGIINDILDYSKIEAGKLDIEHIEFALDKMLGNVANLISDKAADKGLKLGFYVEPGVPELLLGDPLRLGQILVNYANNAVKFTQQGRVDICVRTQKEDDHQVVLYFSVSDTGIGLKHEQLASLFQSFQQADASTTRKFGGTGLGLAISKQLVTLMNGEVGVESELGVGSVFWFTARLDKSRTAVRTPVLRSDLYGKRALVVDDNDNARVILSDMLTALHMSPDSALSGAQALEMVYTADREGRGFEILFLDWQMPGMNGVDLAQRIRALPLKLQPLLVLVTGYGREEVLKSAQNAGIQNVLVKPVSASLLFDCVVRELGGNQTVDAGAAHSASDSAAQLGQIRGARVLLVEDNALNQEVASELLGSVGMLVDVASNGQEAVIQVQTAEYDLVLMDMQMPVMDGLAATRAIRAMPRFASLPIVAMTANAMQSDRDACLQAGMNDHLSKPIEPEQLFQSLLQWISPRRQYLDVPKPVPAPRPAFGAGECVLPPIAGLDTASGLRRVLGNQALYLKLLRKFGQGHANAVADIRQALDDADRPLACRLAHTLKSVAASIGHDGVAQCAAQLEAGATTADRTVLDPHLKSLEAVLLPLLDALAQLATAAPAALASGAPGSMDAAATRLALQALADLVADDDMQALDTLHQNTEVLRVACGEAFGALEAAIEAFDFEAAAALLKKVQDPPNA